MKISGWGRYPVLDCRVEHLREREALPRLFRDSDTVIARGNGGSYGDAALNPDLTVSLLPMNLVRAFDEETGLLTCDAGVLLADILQTFVPRGWFPAVVPGTKFVTVGGMIAADVHGHNHQRDGCFGAHVESLLLATADGEVRTCSRTSHADIFRATLGGMGLTGLILAASFRLRRIATAFVMEETLVAADLDETLELLEGSSAWPYQVAWVDCLARRARLGRSLVKRGAFAERDALPIGLAEEPRRRATGRRLAVRVAAPSGLLNRWSVGLFNELYFRLGRRRPGVRPVHLDSFFFPLDRIEAWNRLYGRRGFVQYHCVLPRSVGRAGITTLLTRIAAVGHGSFLAVLKRFGPTGEGLLSFPMEGYSLALDFPQRGDVLAMLEELDEVVHRRGGRVYLAKDARCGPERMREGYPRLDTFMAIREETAAARPRFASTLSRRLGL